MYPEAISVEKMILFFVDKNMLVIFYEKNIVLFYYIHLLFFSQLNFISRLITYLFRFKCQNELEKNYRQKMKAFSLALELKIVRNLYRIIFGIRFLCFDETENFLLSWFVVVCCQNSQSN